jgi:hypothetical protein
MQIEDVFDDEPIRFSVKENVQTMSGNKQAKMDFPPIIKS